MPIDYKKYPKNWKEIKSKILKRSKNKCELCYAQKNKLHPITKSKVILTVHHIDGNPKHNHKTNLLALCQRCHNKLDLYRKLIKMGKIDKSKQTKYLP